MDAQERVYKQDKTPLQNTSGREVACSTAQELPQRRQFILYLTSSRGNIAAVFTPLQ